MKCVKKCVSIVYQQLTLQGTPYFTFYLQDVFHVQRPQASIKTKIVPITSGSEGGAAPVAPRHSVYNR